MGLRGRRLEKKQSDSSKKKHTGAKLTLGKDREEYISAWNFQKRRGMLTAFIAPYYATGDIHVDKKTESNEYIVMMCKLHYKDSGIEKHFPVLMNIKTHKVVLKDLGMVINPNAKNGGYFGSFKDN